MGRHLISGLFKLVRLSPIPFDCTLDCIVLPSYLTVSSSILQKNCFTMCHWLVDRCKRPECPNGFGETLVSCRWGHFRDRFSWDDYLTCKFDDKKVVKKQFRRVNKFCDLCHRIMAWREKVEMSDEMGPEKDLELDAYLESEDEVHSGESAIP